MLDDLVGQTEDSSDRLAFASVDLACEPHARETMTIEHERTDA